MTVRFIERFESADTSLSYTLPTARYEWTPGQSLRNAYSYGVGASYAYDHYGYASAPMGLSRETIRTWAIGATVGALEAEIDDARATCWRIGLGKLWLLNSDATYRWAWARLAGMPAFEIRPGVAATVHTPMVFEFERISPWFDETATTGSQTIDTLAESVTINNPGNIPVFDITFRFRNSGGAIHPRMVNTTTGYSFIHTRDMVGVNDEIRVATGTRAVEFSPDDGATYLNDYSRFGRGEAQPGIMKLDPGNNAIRMWTGQQHGLPWLASSPTPNYPLEWSLFGAYA